jgi:hypothetical protein
MYSNYQHASLCVFTFRVLQGMRSLNVELWFHILLTNDFIVHFGGNVELHVLVLTRKTRQVKVYYTVGWNIFRSSTDDIDARWLKHLDFNERWHRELCSAIVQGTLLKCTRTFPPQVPEIMFDCVNTDIFLSYKCECGTKAPWSNISQKPLDQNHPKEIRQNLGLICINCGGWCLMINMLNSQRFGD